MGTYIAWGWRIAPWTAGATFVACWLYAFFEYGFLLGVGLGWFPSALVAALAGLLTVYLWGPGVAVAAVAFVLVLGQSRPVETKGLGRPEPGPWEDYKLEGEPNPFDQFDDAPEAPPTTPKQSDATS